MKKAISVGTSAALLASLLATAVAPGAFAAITVGSVGNIAQGSTSATAATFTFVENSAAALLVTPGTVSVTISPAAPVAGTVTFVGTPVLDALGTTGSLGATIAMTGLSTFTVTLNGHDNANVESFKVIGLKIAASAGATQGAIVATVGGTQFAAFVSATATATGILQDPVASTATVGVRIGLNGICPFTVTGTTVNDGNATFSDVADSRAITAAGAATGGVQVVAFAAGANAHPIGVTVTQTVANCNPTIIGSPGTVINAADFETTGNRIVFPGENTARASDVTLAEPAAGFLVAGTVVTLTITTPGVTFSTRPTVTSTAPALQTLTVGAGVTAHAVGVSVTQTHAVTVACPAGATSATLAVATLAAATSLSVLVSTTACPFTATAGTNGPIVITDTVTDTVTATAAVPATLAATTLLNSGVMTLSADRLSATITVDVASTNPATLLFSNIFYDVAATVPGGTFITLKASLSGALVVSPNTAANALVNRGITASAGAATVFIGENAQKTGLVTVTELAKGFFTDGLGANNTLVACLPDTEFFTSPGPWAKVTTGDLRLREGDVASPDNIVPGTPIFNNTFGDFCYKWTIWTASTVASTITIGADAAMTSGPLVDVPAGSVPGTVVMALFIGTDVLGNFPFGTSAVTLSIATRVFRNQVAVTALSQPFISAGSTDAHAGDIQVAETGNGQLKLNELICFEVQPRTSNNFIQDTYLKALNTSDIPVATAGGGVVISSVEMSFDVCNAGFVPEIVLPASTHAVSFRFHVLQQSVTGTGKVVVTNIHYITTADAPTGNVLVNAFGFGGTPTNLVFQATVSNAKIGNRPSIAIGAVSALGAKPTAGYTTKTPKTQKLRKYVTWKFTGGTALAGQRVNVMVATKINGAWGGAKYFASRTADANGIVTFWWKFNTAAAVNVRVQWPGDAGHGSSTSRALGAYWK